MRILAVKEHAVTRGVLDKDVGHREDEIEITFIGNDGVPHTIFAHRDGPYADPRAAIQAWEDGELHAEPHPVEPPGEPLPPQGRADLFNANPNV